MRQDKKDVLIIGGGVLGAFHAYHALNLGLTVALFEKNQAPQGATVRNFGQVVPSGMDTRWQQYGRKSLEVYASIQSMFDIGVRANGSIYVASDEEELQLLQELHQINLNNNYPSVLLTSTACFARYPNLNRAYCKGGLFFPQEISVNPRRMIHQLHAYLQQHPNFTLYLNTCIKSVDSGGAACVATDLAGETYIGDQAIVCSGTEFEWLYPELFKKSDLELVKLQMLCLKPQKKLLIPGNILTGLSIRRYESFAECPSYTQFMANTPADSFWKKWGVHILFKQEADGRIILGDSHEYADIQDKDALDPFLRGSITSYFIEEGAKIMDLEHWDIETQWLGFYTQCKEKDIFQCTVDGRVHIVTGIGGKGMTGSAGFSFEHVSKIFNYD